MPLLIGLKGLVDPQSVGEQNIALSFEMIKLIYHPKETLKRLTFQGLSLRRKRLSRDCGLRVVYTSNGGDTILVVS